MAKKWGSPMRRWRDVRFARLAISAYGELSRLFSHRAVRYARRAGKIRRFTCAIGANAPIRTGFRLVIRHYLAGTTPAAAASGAAA